MTTRADLRPTEKQNIINIIEELGIPEGASIYDWCFGKAEGPNVMLQWFNDLIEEDGKIFFVEGSRDWADKNSGRAETSQIHRAYAVHNLVNTAYMRKLPIHVAVVDGRISKNKNQKERDHADKRVLDHELWWPHHIDPDTGNIVVIRSVPQPEDFDPQAEYKESLQAKNPTEAKPHPPQSDADEVTSPSPEEPPPSNSTKPGDEKPDTQTTLTTTYTRDPEVARQAKKRAADGRCELCGELGFETAQGGYYLEAHHVIPRNCRGPDEIWNVAAICSNDHKRAHFAKDRREVRDQLIQMLAGQYEDTRIQLLELAAKMDASESTEKDLEDDTQTD